MLYRARIVLESYSNRARIAIVIGPLVVFSIPQLNQSLSTQPSANVQITPPDPRQRDLSRRVSSVAADRAKGDVSPSIDKRVKR